MNKNQREYLLSCLKKYGKNSLSYLTLSDSLNIFRGQWEGYIAYKDFFKSATVLGDPIISNDSLKKALDDFQKDLMSKKYHMNIFLCTKKTMNIFNKQRCKCFYVGMEGVVDLHKFTISGEKKWSIRSSVNYAKRNNMRVEEYNYASNKRSKKTEKEILAVSGEWCKLKKTHEFSFAFGHVDFENFDGVRYFVCRHNEKIVGFISYYPIFGINGYYLDLTRRGLDAPRGTIDYLFVRSFQTLKEEGAERIYIGFSPFSYINHSCSINSNLFTNLFTLVKPFFEFFYPAQSEFFFKEKFATDWEPNYAVFYPRISMRNLLSLIHSLCDGGLVSFIIHKSRR